MPRGWGQWAGICRAKIHQGVSEELNLEGGGVTSQRSQKKGVGGGGRTHTGRTDVCDRAWSRDSVGVTWGMELNHPFFL